MARKKRIWYPGAHYHVMCRGNRRGDIFREPDDYAIYLMLVDKAKCQFPFALVGYCLMTNHVHLQIKTFEYPLSKIMQLINCYYTVYFNQKYHLVGHLFQGRYHAILIDTDAYALATNRYIHLNPYKAKMVRAVADYPYSSYPHFIGENHQYLVDAKWIWRYFQGDYKSAYRVYVEDNLEYEPEDYTIMLLIKEDDTCQPI